jgi:hypothetical protein
MRKKEHDFRVGAVLFLVFWINRQVLFNDCLESLHLTVAESHAFDV